MATEHHGIKEEAKQTHCVEVREAVYRKSVLHSHHTQHAKFECNAIDCIGFRYAAGLLGQRGNVWPTRLVMLPPSDY